MNGMGILTLSAQLSEHWACRQFFGRAENRTYVYWVKSAISTSELCRLQKELKKTATFFLQKCCNIFDSCLSDFGILLVWNKRLNSDGQEREKN